MQLKCFIKVFLMFSLGLVPICRSQMESPQAASTPDLWDRAVKIAAENLDGIPGKMIIISEELDKNGAVVKREEIWTRLYCDDSGDIHTEITKDEVKGGNTGIQAQIKPGVKSGEKARSSKENELSLEDFLFNPDFQSQVTKQPSDMKKLIDGRETQGYRFTAIHTEDKKLTGIAWIDIATGTPLLAEFSPDPLPAKVSEMSHSVKYFFNDEGLWRVSEMTTEGKGSFLLMKDHFRIKILLQDYFKKN